MATTINAYKVSLTLDASSYIRNSSLSRSETQSLSRQITLARTPAENYTRTVSRLDKALKEGAITQGTYSRLVDAAADKMKRADGVTNKYASSIKRVAAAYLGFHALKGGATSIVKQTAAAEQSAVAFRVLIGDVQESQEVLKELRSFAASTPFVFPEIAEAGRMLLAFKFSTRELGKELAILGNLAAGTNQPIGELAELVGKARVQTTIYSEDLNQFTGRGINVLDGLAARFGVTTDKVKKLASESKITFNDLQAVLEQLATGEGTFAGLMEEQSKTLAGSWSTLTDNVSSLQIAIGNELLPVIKELVIWTNQLAESEAMAGWGEQLADTARQFRVGLEAWQSDPKANIADRAATEKFVREQEEWLGAQLRLRRDNFATLRTQGSIDAENARRAQIANEPKSGIAVEGAISALKSAIERGSAASEFIAVGLQGVQDAFIQTQWSTTKEVLEAIRSPAPEIASLEVGTQEAYAYLTDQSKRQADELAKEQKRHEEAQRKREEAKAVLSRLLEELKENGFRRIR